MDKFNYKSENKKPPILKDFICKNIVLLLDKNYNISDPQEWVCDKKQISQLMNNDDLKERWLDFWELVKLAWYFGDIKKITKLSIENNVEWIYKIKIESNEFDKLETHIELCNNAIKIDRMEINKFMANCGTGTKYVVNLIYLAKELGFKEIYTTAAKMKNLDKKYKNKWYFFFPKLWFLVSQIDNQKSDIIKKIRKNPEFLGINNINELLLTEDEEWNRIWLERWKKIWDSVLVEFDLSDDSKSMEILRKYLVWRSEKWEVKIENLETVTRLPADRFGIR